MPALDIVLWVVAGFWTFYLVQLIVNRAVIRPLPEAGKGRPGRTPPVSIVSPARNEERGIRAAVSSFCGQDYPDLEVIVVDDCSTDATPRILEELRAEFPNLKVIRGSDPPAGWLGKPHALELGRKAARGKWIAFSDADVVYEPDVISRAVAYAEREGAGMLCLWPEVITGEVLEAVILSHLAFIFAITPAFLVTRSRWKLFAAGAGVFNMARRDALEGCGAFESLKDAVVDDVELSAKIKGAGFPLALALAQDSIRIRIYHGAREALEGFTKNIYPAVRPIRWALPPLWVCAFALNLLPYLVFGYSLVLGAPSVPALAALALMHMVLGGCSRVFRLPWYVAFLGPVREVLWWWIVLRSFRAYSRGGITWRGRTYGPMG